MYLLNNNQSGFTLIEMIVSLALFATVATVSVGALLVLVASNVQLQNEQSVMTNLSFALDSMSREIRTGTDYFCDSQSTITANMSGVVNIFNDDNDLDEIFDDADIQTRDCMDGMDNNTVFHGIAFKEGGHSITDTGERILYFFDKIEGKIFRRVGNGPAQSIVSSGIYIINAEFYVSGSDPLSLDADELDQPTVTIFIEAREVDDVNIAKPYWIQSTIVQRALDI